MGHDVVGILLLEIGGRNGVGYAAESADDEQEYESQGVEHRGGQLDAAFPHRAEPVENLDAGRHGDQHSGDGEYRVGDGAEAHGKHMVAPHRPAHNADDDAGENDEGVAEKGLFGEGGQDFGHDPHRGQDEDVDLGVAEHPEQVLPEDRVAAAGGVKEVGSEVAVHHQLDQADGDYRHSQDQQDGGYQGHPHEYRHSHQRHTGGAEVDDGHYEVETAGDRGNAQHQQADGPEIEAQVFAEGVFGEVGVGKPSGVRHLVNDKAEVHQDAAEQENPVGKGVEAGEGHIAGADGEGDDEVKEGDAHRHNDHKDHYGGVHGEHLIEPAGADQIGVGGSELGTDDARFDAGNEHKDESGSAVHHADALVVDGGDPAPQAAGAVGGAGQYLGYRCHPDSPPPWLPATGRGVGFPPDAGFWCLDSRWSGNFGFSLTQVGRMLNVARQFRVADAGG